MSSYRTMKRAVVHPVRSAKAFQPYCNLSYRNLKELRENLVTYMRQYEGMSQKIVVDTDIQGILINGEHRYNYELIEPVRPVEPAVVNN